MSKLLLGCGETTYWPGWADNNVTDADLDSICEEFNATTILQETGGAAVTPDATVTTPDAPAGSKTGLIIGVVAGVAVLAGGFFWWRSKKTSDDEGGCYERML